MVRPGYAIKYRQQSDSAAYLRRKPRKMLDLFRLVA
jgi:hypothetical protein